MPTSSVNISSNWTKVANQTDNSLLITWKPSVWLEIATTATNTAPVIDGHEFPAGSRVSRQDIGDGFVWARSVAGSVPSSLAVTVSTASTSATTKGYDPSDDMVKVKSMQKKFRDDFAGASLNTDKWESQVGAGGGISQGGGSLVLSSGTVANSETWVMTKETFSIPFRVQAAVMMSQRIANHNLLVEAISVDPVTGVPDGKNQCTLLFNGTTATQAIYRVQNDGATPLDSSAQTFPTTAVHNLFELEPFSDECWFHGGAYDAITARSNSYRRHQQIPDPNAVYKIRIRNLNGATAPASAVSSSLTFIAIQDYAELTAEITGGRGQAVAGQSLGVVLTVAPSVNATEVGVLSANTYQLTSAASTNGASVKSTAGAVTGIFATNLGGTDAFLKLYNKASAPTVGTDVPIQVIRIPANNSVQINTGRLGLRMTTGIASAVTGAAAIADTTAIAANQVLVTLCYT